MEKRGKFNLQQYLQTKPEYSGSEILGVEEGKPLVRTKSGDEFLVDPTALIQAEGQDPAEWDFEVNTPDKPLPYSPLSPKERMFWNLTDSVMAENLTKQFGEVRQDPEKGLVVKRDGAWLQIDPDFFEGRDPWALTKSILETAFKSSPVGQIASALRGKDAKQEALTAAKGIPAAAVESGAAAYEGAVTLAKTGAEVLTTGSLTGPRATELASDIGDIVPEGLRVGADVVGTSVGGTPGGVGARAAMSSVLLVGGKLAGITKMSNEDIIREAGLDTIFNIAGNVVAAGAKPTLEGFNEALKSLAGKANSEGRRLLAGMLASTSGANKELMEKTFLDTDNFIKQQKVLSKINPKNLMEAGARHESKILKGALEEIDAVPSRNYGNGLKQIFSEAGPDAKVVPTQIVDNTLLQAEKTAPWLRVRRDKNGRIAGYQFLNSIEAAERGLTEVPSEAQQKLLAEYLDVLLKEKKTTIVFGIPRQLTGNDAPTYLVGLDKRLSQIERELGKRENAPVLGKFIGDLRKAHEVALNDSFEQMGIGSRVKELRSQYRKELGAANWLDSELRKASAIDKNAAVGTLLNKAFSKDPAKALDYRDGLFGSKDRLGALQLLGTKGAEIAEELKLTRAVMETTPWFKGQFRATTGGAIGLMGGAAALTGGIPAAIAVPGAATIAAAMSPRMAQKVAKYSLLTSNAIRNMDRAAIDGALQNPALLRQLLSQPIRAAAQEDAATADILQRALGNAGVLPE